MPSLVHRLIHVSDLHFLPSDMARLEALRAAIAREGAALVIITGDLTRAGRRREFRAARAFVESLATPAFVVPGNHDVPVSDPAARILRPLGRFDRFFPGEASIITAEGALVLARLDTARGVSRSWDWSLGAVSDRALGRLAQGLAKAPQAALRMVACHHPLLSDPADPHRSRTRGGMAALQFLARHEVAILFHGHLHRTSTRLLPAGERHILSIGAGTLSERERGAGASFNLVTIQRAHVEVTEMLWTGRDFAAGQRFSHDGVGTIGALRD
jgi:3',5'-cyclic AMP phosphodiesterase CpdA